MAYEIGTATDYRDLLRRLVRFLAARGAIGTPVYTGAGNGLLVDLETASNVPTETWTLACSSATKVGAANYGTTIAADSPVVHWRFNEAAGSSVAQDATANNIDGINTGASNVQHWRINVSGNAWPTVGIAEIELRATVGGADLTGAGLGTAFASSFWNSSYLVGNAFDNDNATVWQSDNAGFPQHVGYVLNTPAIVRQVAIRTSPTGSPVPANAGPRDFTIEFSDDGVRWFVVKSVTGATWVADEQKLFDIPADSVTAGVAGLLSVDTNQAFSFAGGAVVSAANALLQLTANATLECIVKPSSIVGTQFIAGIGGQGAANAENQLIGLWMAEGYLRIRHEYGGGNAEERTSDYKLVVGRTYHVVLSRDDTIKRYQLIVGGIVVYTYDYTFAASDGGSSYLNVALTPEGLYPFAGTIDEVALYASALTESLARAHAEAALGHETFTVVGTVSGAQANAIVGLPYKTYLQFTILDGSIDFLIGNNWVIGVTAGPMGAQAWQVNRSEENQVFLQGPGLAGGDEIFVSVKTYFDAGADYYNWEIRGADGYDAGQTETGQPNVCPARYMPAWNTAIPYWFRASGRFFIVVAKISTTYQGCYAGLCLPFATPTQYPYPMLVGGSTKAAANRFSLATNDAGMFFSPCENGLCLRHVDGAWLEFFNLYTGLSSISDNITHPYHRAATPTVGFANFRDDPNAVQPIFPISLLATGDDNPAFRGVLGILDGCCAVSGFNNAAENVVDIDGTDWIVFQNIFRTGVADYFAVEMA